MVNESSDQRVRQDHAETIGDCETFDTVVFAKNRCSGRALTDSIYFVTCFHMFFPCIECAHLVVTFYL